MHPPLLHQSVSLATTAPLHGDGDDMMETVIHRRIRWDDVHRQARRIAATNARLRLREAECEFAERRARELARGARTTQLHAALIALCAAIIALLAAV